MAFPTLTHSQRTALCLDPEAYYSITPGYAAQDMVEIIFGLLQHTMPPAPGERVVVDCTAGGGGNSLAFLHSQSAVALVAIELQTARAQMLEQNLTVACDPSSRSTHQVVCGNCVDWLFSMQHRQLDVLFFDPPWGGLDYMSEFKGRDGSPSDFVLNDSGKSLGDILALDIPFGPLKHKVRLAAIKVPALFPAKALFDRVTAEGAWETGPSGLEERPHPFRMQIGARIALLVVAYPPFAQNALLDDMLVFLQRFNADRGEEFHPRYYDWEKRNWVSAKQWKGFSGAKAPA
ncbi:hypothetical protein HDV03_003158 [Kappamyces sp. JEL0829]|nr:hypothetical protein HDV03_003158 [Kappamyces sp. JEL0829]